jgi:hypothetical protein
MRQGPSPAARRTDRQLKPDNREQRAVPIELIPLDAPQPLVATKGRTVAINLHSIWDARYAKTPRAH